MQRGSQLIHGIVIALDVSINYTMNYFGLMYCSIVEVGNDLNAQNVPK